MADLPSRSRVVGSREIPQNDSEGPLMRLLLFFGLAFNCFAGIWDPALNFNAPNNVDASSVFSYGVGGTPGTFAELTNTIVDCIGGTTYCYNNGASFPNASAVIWNGSGSTITYSVVQP